MSVTTPEFETSCQTLLDRFFAAYPAPTMQERAHKALGMLRASEKPLKDKPAGWAAGIVYAVGSRGVGVPDVQNRDFESAFGVRMTEVYKRAAMIRELLGTDLPSPLEDLIPPDAFTLRDEANAMCAYAFRNDFLEDIHADGRISDEEMKRLMIQASKSMAKLLAKKKETPLEYERFIRDYHRKFCLKWDR